MNTTTTETPVQDTFMQDLMDAHDDCQQCKQRQANLIALIMPVFNAAMAHYGSTPGTDGTGFGSSYRKLMHAMAAAKVRREWMEKEGLL